MPLALADQVFGSLTRLRDQIDPLLDKKRSRQIAARYKETLRKARRHYVDDEVTEAAVTLGHQHPDVLAAMLSRARTPFETMWFEWPLSVALAAVGQEKEDDAPERIGCLIERLHEAEPLYRMTAMSALPGGNVISPISIVYHLTKPLWGLDPGSEAAKILKRHHRVLFADPRITNMAIDAYHSEVAFLLGSTYTRPREGDDEQEISFRRERCMALGSHASFVFSPMMGETVHKMLNHATYGDMLSAAIYATAADQAGQWRLILSLLAVMNSRDRPVDETPWRAERKNRLVGGQIVPFLDHIMVKLKLPRRIMLPRIVREAHSYMPRRRHEVEGHWKERLSSGDPECDHAWHATNETSTKEECGVCGRRRWWVNEFMRGSAEIGVVTKDRLLTRR